eukprot:gene7914-8769_t
MLSRRDLFKVFVAICCIVALITTKVYMKYDFGSKLRRRNSGEKGLQQSDVNKDTTDHYELHSQAKTQAKESDKKLFGNTMKFSVGERLELHTKIGNLKGQTSEKAGSKFRMFSTTRASELNNVVHKLSASSMPPSTRTVSKEELKTRRKLKNKIGKISTRPDLKTPSFIVTSASISLQNQTVKLSTNQTTEQINNTNDIEDNDYMKNIGNHTIYGDANCGGNPDRNVLNKIFTRWKIMAKESGLEYFLSCGTLLGSFRNGDLIPHDTDMDVLIHRRDYKKIKKYISKRNFTGYENDFHFVIQEDFRRPYESRRRFTCQGKLVPSYRDHCSFQEPLARLISENRHLDIYDYSIRGNKIWDPSEGGHEFDQSEVFPFKKCIFMGHETTCPNNPVRFLSKLYGNNLEPLKLCKNGEWVKRSG